MPLPTTHTPVQVIRPNDVPLRPLANSAEFARLTAMHAALITGTILLRDLLAQQQRALDAMQHLAQALADAPPSRWSGAKETSVGEMVPALSSLTERQREVLALVVEGYPSKGIALVLGISQRTVENHRASIMIKTRSSSLPALARWAFNAAND